MGILSRLCDCGFGLGRAHVMALLAGLIFVPAAIAQESLSAHGYRMAGDARRMRVILEFDREPEVRWFLLRGPHRLVVDFPETTFAIDPRELEAHGLIANVRYGNIGKGRSRMIVAAAGPFEVERLEVTANESSPGYRLIADMIASSDEKFEAALARRATSAAIPEQADQVPAPPAGPASRFTIVLDPGHGGIDSGAAGVSGTPEKSITLAFSLELKAKLLETGRYDVFLTREKDEFLRLDERVRIARQHGADLFISIHADTIRLKGIRGATVYTMSERASDSEAEAFANRENLADAVAGIELPEENQEVADILADLMRRETHNFTMRFARSLVGELSESILLINNPLRSAGFRVLKAPDVPSVLVELGYLSNPKDEAQLRSAEWRGKAIDSIASAIAGFASARRAAGG